MEEGLLTTRWDLRDRYRRAGLRLAFWIPLTPWPAILWIQAQGAYSTGRHSAEALNPVGGLAFLATLGSHLIGLCLLAKCSRRDDEAFVPCWILFALFNGIAMWSFIVDHAVAYA